MIFYHGSYLEIAEKQSIVCVMKSQTCKSVSAQKKHWSFYTLKGVRWYERKPDFTTKKI